MMVIRGVSHNTPSVRYVCHHFLLSRGRITPVIVYLLFSTQKPHHNLPHSSHAAAVGRVVSISVYEACKFRAKHYLRINYHTLSLSLTILCEYKYSKFGLTAVTAMTDHARTRWRECGRSGWADTKATRLATNTSFNTINSTICCRTDHFFTAILVCRDTCWRYEDMTEAICHDSHLCDVIFIRCTDKNIFI